MHSKIGRINNIRNCVVTGWFVTERWLVGQLDRVRVTSNSGTTYFVAAAQILDWKNHERFRWISYEVTSFRREKKKIPSHFNFLLTSKRQNGTSSFSTLCWPCVGRNKSNPNPNPNPVRQPLKGTCQCNLLKANLASYWHTCGVDVCVVLESKCCFARGGNPNCIIIRQASWWHCANSRGR